MVDLSLNMEYLTFIANQVSIAQQVYGDEEWSFGFCEQGYWTHPLNRETTHSVSIINQKIRELSRDLSGESYDLLAKNCTHFCDEF